MSTDIDKIKMKSERAKRALTRSKTTQTTEPHRKFFVLILERAGGQNVRHLLVNVTAKLSFTFLTSEYHRSPKYIMGKIEKNRLMAWQSHFKKHDTAPRIYFERQFVARSCADIGITPSHSTVIHHKRASRYVVLGEISHSPFTTYIFTSPRCFLYVFRESGHH